VAIALRNRWRRMQVDRAAAQEITPKNILMIGPDRLRQDRDRAAPGQAGEAPFVKVEATKFTEVGYVGRDVDSIIKDLADGGRQDDARKRCRRPACASAEEAAEERVLDALLPRPRAPMGFSPTSRRPRAMAKPARNSARCCARAASTTSEIEIEISAMPGGVEIMAPPGMEEMQQQLSQMFQNLGQGRTRARKHEGARRAEAAGG
jgi:ATP-dependent HslUV protease ATP-binding subunit HslU